MSPEIFARFTQIYFWVQLVLVMLMASWGGAVTSSNQSETKSKKIYRAILGTFLLNVMWWLIVGSCYRRIPNTAEVLLGVCMITASFFYGYVRHNLSKRTIAPPEKKEGKIAKALEFLGDCGAAIAAVFETHKTRYGR